MSDVCIEVLHTFLLLGYSPLMLDFLLVPLAVAAFTATSVLQDTLCLLLGEEGLSLAFLFRPVTIQCCLKPTFGWEVLPLLSGNKTNPVNAT